MSNKYNNNIIDTIITGSSTRRIGNYVSSTVPIEWKCTTCHHTWMCDPGSLLYRIRKGTSGCRNCAGLIKLTDSDIDELIRDKLINRIGKYKNIDTPIQWQCTVCLCTWRTKPAKILNENTGCPDCSYKDRNKSRRLTNSIVDDRIKYRLIERVGDVVDSSTKTLWCCKECLYEWKATPNCVINNYTGCPVCGLGPWGTKVHHDGIKFDSHLEYDCYRILKDKFCDIQTQKPYPTTPRKRCDFYIPSLKLWIEVSSIKTTDYKSRIHIKQQLINDFGENFMFFDSPKSLIKELVD